MSWHKCAKFDSQDKARSTWKQLYDELRNLHVDLTTFSMIYGSDWYVVAVAEHTPALHVQAIVDRYLAKGTASSLPDEVVSQLIERRANRTQYASRKPGSPSLVYEGHQPTPIPSGGQVSKESQEEHLRTVVQSLHQQGYPFIETYRMYVGYRLYDRIGLVGSESPLKKLITDMLDESSRYLFTESARAMHKAVYRENSTFLETHTPIWIEQDIPQPFTSRGMNLKAVHVFKTPLKDQWVINVIKDTTEHAMSMTYEPEEGYTPTIDYECPTGKCEDIQIPYTSKSPNDIMVYRRPCSQCEQDALLWASWLHTAIQMIQRVYAVSSDPKPFEVKNLSYSEKRLVPRHHGKGKPKEKLVTVDIPYVVVAFEISGTRHHAVSDERAEGALKRENWLTLASPDDIIYELRSIPAYDRRYPIRRNGTRKEGSVAVREVEQKYVPMLAPLKRKASVKKVVAKRYEQKEAFE